MDNLNKYRHVCIQYLLSRVKYFNEPADNVLDASYRLLKGLPKKPVDDDEYNGLLGHKPVVEQRTELLTLLKGELEQHNKIIAQDLHLDSIVRYINKLSKRTSKVPYVDLFKIDNIELPVKNTEPSKDLSNFKTNQEGIDLMHQYEGYRECTYKDPGSASGLPITGGWGSTRLNGKKLQLGQCYSKEIWVAQFKLDLSVFEDAVKRHVKVPLTVNQFSALVSFCYNCGEAAFMNSTGLKRLNEGNYRGCWVALSWFKKGANGQSLPGLVKRRKAEAKLAGFDI